MKKNYFPTFSIDINVPPLRTQKVIFSALVQQEMLKGVNIDNQQEAYCILIPEYGLLACTRKKQQHSSQKTVLVPFHWNGHKSCYIFHQKKNLFFAKFIIK